MIITSYQGMMACVKCRKTDSSQLLLLMLFFMDILVNSSTSRKDALHEHLAWTTFNSHQRCNEVVLLSLTGELKVLEHF